MLKPRVLTRGRGIVRTFKSRSDGMRDFATHSDPRQVNYKTKH